MNTKSVTTILQNYRRKKIQNYRSIKKSWFDITNIIIDESNLEIIFGKKLWGIHHLDMD
jgi:hypothetical protein